MRRKIIGVVAIASAVSAAVGGAVVTHTADAATQSHTWRFVAHLDRSHGFNRTAFASTEIERHNGSVVGLDVISGSFSPPTQTGVAYVAVARRGGLLYATVRINGDQPFTGRVTGGAGDFRGATGTVSGHPAAGDDNKTIVTVKWHT